MSEGFRVPLAFDQNGKLIKPAPDLPDGTYSCPGCKTELILRQGERVRPHFAHRPAHEDADGKPCSQGDVLHKIATLILKQVIQSWLSGDCPAPQVEVRCAGPCRGFISFPIPTSAETLVEAGDLLVLLSSCFDPVLKIQLRDGRVAHQAGRLVALDPEQVIEHPLAWRAAGLFGFTEFEPFCSTCKRAVEGRRRVPDPRLQDVPQLVFGQSGLMVQGGYEYRDGQLAMAQAVDKAVATNSHLMVEGPCGTGKSLAYLASTITHGMATGRRVVIATSNIALQAQLIEKDLPFLRDRVLKCHFDFALLKGRNNYLCPTRFEEWQEEFKRVETPEHTKVRAWARATKTGDQRELGYRPEFWADISGQTDTCTECQETTGCFYQSAKDRAGAANVIVVNHALLFAHLVVKRASMGMAGVLPPFRILVCDEGHELADEARRFFGFELTETNLLGIAKFYDNFKKAPPGSAAKMLKTAQLFFAKVRELKSKHLTSPWINGAAEEETKEILAHLLELNTLFENALLDLLDGAPEGGWQIKGKEASLAKAIRNMERSKARVENAYYALTRVATGECDKETNSPYAVWREETFGYKSTSTKLCGQPVVVSEYLRRSLFEQYDSVIVTSATLTSNDSFDYLAEELGFVGTTLAVPSPFDFDTQAMLVFPNVEEMPVTPAYDSKEQFYGEAARCIEDAITYSNGSALCLFTSFKSIREVRQRMPPMPFKFLAQSPDGKPSRESLIEEFKRDQSSVLFGVDSFWTGVDVPGEALILLVIEKLPFPTPDDPFNEYWKHYYEGSSTSEDDPGAAGQEVFRRYAIPQALIKLRQGVGRLIRSKTDYGVVLILDRRVLTKPYGSLARNSLPFSRYKVGLQNLKEFFERQRQAKIASIPTPLPVVEPVASYDESEE